MREPRCAEGRATQDAIRDRGAAGPALPGRAAGGGGSPPDRKRGPKREPKTFIRPHRMVESKHFREKPFEFNGAGIAKPSQNLTGG